MTAINIKKIIFFTLISCLIIGSVIFGNSTNKLLSIVEKNGKWGVIDETGNTVVNFQYDGDFLGYLGLEDKGFITNHDANYLDKIKKLAESL